MIIYLNGNKDGVFYDKESNWQPGSKLAIKFQYSKKDNGLITTECVVSSIVEEDGTEFSCAPLSIGYAYQSKKDAHCKSIARKVALKNALAVLSKEDRTKIWEQYFSYVKYYN